MTKSKSRSKQAKRQFRGPDGRFIRPTYIVIDDFGSVSPYHHRERCFGYAYAITTNPEDLEELARDNRKRHDTDSEVKATDDRGLWNRVRMTIAIRNLGVPTGAVYVDKKRPPQGWDTDKRPDESKKMYNRRLARVRKGVLDYAIDRALEGTQSYGVMVVVDEHSSLKHVGELCRSKTTRGRVVDGNTFSSSDSDFKDLLQAQDYVANAAGSATKGFPLRAHAMRMKIHRLRRYERIKV